MKIILLIFSLAICTLANAQYTKLLDFDSTSGSNPYGSLIADGTFLYGMTGFGGTINLGVIFKIKPDGTGYSKLLDFAGTSNGDGPHGSLISDGTFLYGMTRNGGTINLGVVFKIQPDGTDYTKLLDFDWSVNGGMPYGSLISDGTFLYGMITDGGPNNMGVVFKIKPDGTNYTKLLDFDGNSNGKWPRGSLISDGTFLYGMTRYGGTNDSGVVFKIKPDGTFYTKLLDFAGTSNGSYPFGSLIFDGTFLYGMTAYGGTNGCGIIFKIMPDGTNYTKLMDFAGTSNGSNPFGSLISDGTFLYGMTGYGGTNGYGIIFKIMPDGTNYTKLLDFSGSSNGSYPGGSLISDGTFLYGMTLQGGTNDMGTIFKYAISACPPVNFSQSPTICNGQSITVGSNTYTASGTYTDTLSAGNGCDSIITTSLTVNSTYSVSQTDTINDGDSIQVGNTVYNSTGTYIDTLITSNGCDSIITTNLTVITGINAIDEQNTKVKIFPNPNNGKFTVSTPQAPSRIVIYNLLGENIFSTSNLQLQTSSKIDLSNQPNGIYFVRMKSAENIYYQKLLKQ